MKKIYLSLVALLLCLPSFAQKRTIKLGLTLTSPADGSSIPKEMPFDQKFVIKNLGPAAIKPTDTIAYTDPATPSGSLILLRGYTKAVGDTIQVNLSGYSFPAAAPEGPGNYCVSAGILNRTDTVIFDTTGRTFIDCNVVTATPPTGISEIVKETVTGEQLGISPNPATAAISFDFTAKSKSAIVVKVYDLTGRVVLSSNYGNVSAGQNGFNLDIATLNKGTYFVEIRQDEYKAVGKLLKQ